MDKSSEPIYVVGFPKSGNTWLARLMADVLQVPVLSGVMRGGPEIASEINKTISSQDQYKFNIQKIHFEPEVFFNEIDSEPKRIIYIYRDFRDVVISAFFYFKWGMNGEAGVRKENLSNLLKKPINALRYFINRRKLLKFIKSFSLSGLENIGNWSQHIAKWQGVSEKRPEINMIFVSYEELLKDTENITSQILDELELPNPSSKELADAVQRQSFASTKERLEKITDDAEIPFGKEFNVKFLRKGLTGDWRNFLSPQMGKFINNCHDEMLFDLGYVDDQHWYKKL